MKIKTLYTYPIKSLRPHTLQEAEVTKHGFKYDRRFMLLQATKDGYKNMHLSTFNSMVLFSTKLTDVITVTYNQDSIEIPLEPSVDDLEVIEVDMHGSKCSAYKMNSKYNDWFSKCFEFEVILAYLGQNYRPVLMSTSSTKTWLSSIAPWSEEKEITFADCAPYLVVSEKSMDSVNERLPGEMNLEKFRPNIVISGAEKPWEEDYWGEITIGQTKIETVHNCGRCRSINIDYSTGKQGLDEDGKILARLQKDRRIDAGTKYSPIFGRYSFLRGDDGIIRVGDEVVVSKLNKGNTRFGRLCPVLRP